MPQQLIFFLPCRQIAQVNVSDVSHTFAEDNKRLVLDGTFPVMF